jgi:hypothetical protein
VLGDTDGDGIVEAEDLTPIRTNYLQTVTMRSQGDLTGDLMVTFADFRQWKTEYLEANPGGGSLAGVDLGFLNAVPEPSALILVLTGLLGLWQISGARRAGSRGTTVAGGKLV